MGFRFSTKFSTRKECECYYLFVKILIQHIDFQYFINMLLGYQQN